MQEKNILPSKQVDELVKDYVQGMSIEEIKSKYGIHQAAINSYLAQKKNLQRKYEIEPILHEAREVQRITEIKDQILDYINLSMQEALSKEKKLNYVDKITELLEKLDRIVRLTQQKATEIVKSEETSAHFDVAKIMKELKTSEDKKGFLLKQLNKS